MVTKWLTMWQSQQMTHVMLRVPRTEVDAHAHVASMHRRQIMSQVNRLCQKVTCGHGTSECVALVECAAHTRQESVYIPGLSGLHDSFVAYSIIDGGVAW